MGNTLTPEKLNLLKESINNDIRNGVVAHNYITDIKHYCVECPQKITFKNQDPNQEIQFVIADFKNKIISYPNATEANLFGNRQSIPDLKIKEEFYNSHNLLEYKATTKDLSICVIVNIKKINLKNGIIFELRFIRSAGKGSTKQYIDTEIYLSDSILLE